MLGTSIRYTCYTLLVRGDRLQHKFSCLNRSDTFEVLTCMWLSQMAQQCYSHPTSTSVSAASALTSKLSNKMSTVLRDFLFNREAAELMG